jgi:hypothetical protein
MFVRIASFCCALGLLVAAGPAHADVSIGASPAFLDLELEPGKTTAQTVLLFNSGKDPVTVRAYAWDWWHDEKNPKKFAAPGTLPHSAARWISFVPRTITVSPGKAVNVTITVATPKTATGGAYAVAWFEAVPEDKTKSKKLLVGARLGVLLMTQVRGHSRGEIAIDKFAIHPPTGSKLLRADVLMRNTGDVHLFPKGTMVVLDKKNKMVGHASFEKRRMLPDEKSAASITWGGELKQGDYQGVLTVDYGDAGATLKSVAFTVGSGNTSAVPAAKGSAAPPGKGSAAPPSKGSAAPPGKGSAGTSAKGSATPP